MEATTAGWEQKALASVIAKFPSFQRYQDSALLLHFCSSTSSVETFSFSLPCSPDQSWRKRSPLPQCSLKSTKLPFSPAKPAFLPKGSLTSLERVGCLLHRSPLKQNKSFLIACCPLNVPCLNKTDSLSIHPVLAWLPGRSLTVGSLATSVQVHLGSNNKSRRRLFPLYTINSNHKPFTGGLRSTSESGEESCNCCISCCPKDTTDQPSTHEPAAHLAGIWCSQHPPAMSCLLWGAPLHPQLLLQECSPMVTRNLSSQENAMTCTCVSWWNSSAVQAPSWVLQMQI